MLNKQDAGDKKDLSKSTDPEKYLPIDPSNTSSVGQPVETPIVQRDKNISEQSAKWEDLQERTIPKESIISPEAEKYIKNPSPEENEHNDIDDDVNKTGTQKL